MSLRFIVALCVVELVLTGSARAQTFHVVSFDPSLSVFDINNELRGVGRQGSAALATPFIIDPSGIRFFPEFPTLYPFQINDSGVMVGPGTLSALGGVFRVRRDGSGYAEKTFPFGTFAEIVQLTDNGVVLLNTFNFHPTRFRAEAFLVHHGQVIYLNDHFRSPSEYLAVTNTITDSGFILALAYSINSAAATRCVLLVPSPVAPTAVQTTVNGRFVSVSWQPAFGADEYIVEAGGSPGSSDFFNSSVGSSLSVGGVVPAGRYYIRVRGKNLTAIGPASPELVVDVR
jgi:hypothetical protein